MSLEVFGHFLVIWSLLLLPFGLVYFTDRLTVKFLKRKSNYWFSILALIVTWLVIALLLGTLIYVFSGPDHGSGVGSSYTLWDWILIAMGWPIFLSMFIFINIGKIF